MTALRIHPGYAVLMAVAVVTAIALAGLNGPPLPLSGTTSAPGGRTDAVPASHSGLSGVARVIDGDTIDIQGVRIRLNGIDAPETKQHCVANDSSNYRCGLQATEALISLIGSNVVRCDQTGTDRNGRVIGRCAIGSLDIGGWMVEHGWAVAYRRFSLAYVDQENRARALKSGIWAGSFTSPEDWRRQKREGVSQ